MTNQEQQETRIIMARILDVPPDDIKVKKVAKFYFFTYCEENSSIGLVFDAKPSVEYIIDQLSDMDTVEDNEEIDEFKKDMFNLKEYPFKKD